MNDGAVPIGSSSWARHPRVPRFWGVIPVALIAVLLAVRAWLHVAPLDRLAIAAGDAKDPAGTVARAGSIYIARGGPVIIGFYSERPARLSFAGRELAGTGVVKERIIVPRGAQAIRFAAPGGAVLVWNPVGRRGDPEYVSPSSLSPAPPDAAVFDAPGVARLDGAIALAVLVIVIATLCMLARARLAAVPRAVWIATAGVLAAGLAARWIDLGGFGQTWDEDVNWVAGRNYITNLLDFDVSIAAWQWNYQHPPVMKLLAGIGAQFADGFGPARAMSAIWSALGCALLVPIGARLFSLRVGALAALIAALLPPMVAHGQIVGHESPTVLWWSLAVLLALGVHDRLPDDERAGLRVLRRRLIWLGVAIGIAIASRFVNGLVAPLCGLILLAQSPVRWRRATVLWGALLLLIAASATLYIVWPLLWTQPLTGLFTALRKLGQPHATEPFLGTVTNRPGPHYFVVYLFATLPVGVLIAVLIGSTRLALERTRSALITAAWVAIPLGVMASPVRQDGVRYVMPCLLTFALIAAVGIEQLALWIRARRAFGIAAGVLAGYLAITLFRVHPYYLDYFGEHVGGAGRVADRGMFEVAWWGEGIDRAVDYVNTHAAPGDRVDRRCIEPNHLAWFRDDLWPTLAQSANDADWIVHYAPARRPCEIPAYAREVYRITSDGAVMAIVYRR